MPSPDLTITRRMKFERARPADVERLRGFATSVIGDGMGRRCALGSTIQARTRAVRFAGSALTVRCRASDNLAALVSLESTRPGDVVVIACGPGADAAIVGGNYLALAKARGAVAVVTDGLVRDIDEVDALGIPVFATGFTPNGPFKTGPGEIGLPISLGGLQIESGDLLVGDKDGVVVIAQQRVAEAIERAAAVQAREEAMGAAIAAGTTPDFIERLVRETDVRDLE